MNMNQLKEQIKFMAWIQDIEILKIRKSRKHNGYFVYKTEGESVYVGLDDLEYCKKQFYKFFGVRPPKIVKVM